MSAFAAKLEEARRKLPLRRLMEQYGRGPENGNWKTFPKCPYCQKKGAGVFSGKGGELFKCHHVSCSSGTGQDRAAWDEIGFLQHEANLNRSEATKLYFKQAGVWQERERHAPSVLPGQRARSKPFPSDNLPPPESTPHSLLSAGVEPSAPDCEAQSSQTASATESPNEDGGAAVPDAPPVADSVTASLAGSPTAPLANDAALSSADNAGTPAVTSTEAPVPDAAPPVDLNAPREDRESILEKVIKYIRFAEKRKLSFADVESIEGFAAAKWIMQELERREVIGPLDEKRGDHKVLKPKADVVPPPAPPGAPPGGSPPPGRTPAPASPPPPPLAALRWFYTRLHLTDEDRDQLWRNRGLHAGTCDILGYRSNPRANEELLLEMEKHFPIAVLVDCGLWSERTKATGKPKPNPQFYGMSLVMRRDESGSKIKEDGQTVFECVWNNPILIPYFDEAGELIHLRPHKGMMKDKPARFYVARPAKEFLAQWLARPNPNPQFAVITEGEFKAGAIWQALGDIAAVGSVPGITTAKPLFGDIEEWMESLGTRRVTIGYDNEDKSNPKLPGYKKEPWKRFDAQIWARYLARQLGREGYESRVAVLPKEWRNKDGKADWDGYLARLIQDSGLSLEGSVEMWKQVHSTARAQFLAVIESAVAVNELWQAGFFDSEEERIIKNALERISYESKLPIGGEAEIAISRRLFRLAAKLRSDTERLSAKKRGFLIVLAQSYQKLSGGYYILKPLRDNTQTEWQLQLGTAYNRDDVEIKRACDLVLKGIPQRVSDFYMKAHYVLNRLNGTRCRLVTLHNLHGVNTKMLLLPSAPFSQPSKFREWLLDNITGATWSAGERELNLLQEDIARDVAHKDVLEVAVRGYHAESKCWFFRDVTFTPEGKEVYADRSGIVWIRQKGKTDTEEIAQAYKLAETDHERQSFRHGEPRMHPERKSDDATVGELFQNLAAAIHETIGNHNGWLALGIILAFGAAPEIYSAFNGFPGLWLHGETRQGKSSVARWLLRLWGIYVREGLALKDSTKVGISIALQQYGNLPIFLEEFQPNAPDWMIEKLKNMFGRESGSKKTFDEGDRKILTNGIVTGIATSTDAQVRSRYAHVQVARENRRGNHYRWFEDTSDDFFFIGRYIMRHRKEFAEKVVATMHEWLNSPDIQNIDERARVVHGAAFASFSALHAMLSAAKDVEMKYPLPKAMDEFKTHLIAHSAAAVQEVHDQVNVNQFWRELLDALKSDAFGETPSERCKIFKVVENDKGAPALTPQQLRWGEEDRRRQWKSYLLYFQPGPVIDMLRRYKRLQGRELPLDRNDLRAQMRVRPYWVDPKRRNGEAIDTHRQRFGPGSKTPESCWCVDLDKHELGLRLVSDEDLNNSFYKDGIPTQGNFLGMDDDWIDPRRGDLFALVDALRSQMEKELA